jgi:hypothetical protein
VRSSVLYLRREEKTVFDALRDALKNGWSVEDEPLTSDERPEELRMRYQMAKFEDADLQNLVQLAQESRTPEEFEKTALKFDFAKLPQEQIAEVFFMLGTKLMGKIISYGLQEASSDEDIEGIAALSNVRHLLLEANASVS